jgi:uncharacterized membrane protein/osmotically-inducible protein OsmY
MKIVFKPNFSPHFAPHKTILHTLARPDKEAAARQEKRMGMLTAIRQQTRQGLAALGGLGVGAGLMYILDPDRGRRRRAMVRDQIIQALHETGDALDAGVRDLNNRAFGAVFNMFSFLLPSRTSDSVLTERIRATLGRCVAFPHAIQVAVTNGHVTLSGHVLRQDVDRLTNSVKKMKGVKGVTDTLTVHEKPGETPDMMGRPRPVHDRAPLERRWTPATRLGVTAAGAFLALYGLKRRGLTGFGFGMVGLSMVAKGLKKPLAHSFSANSEFERGVDLQKTINIDAPLDRVFKMLSNPENFPRFMSHVQQVKQLEDGGHRWTVSGPGGALAHWDADITKSVDNELLEWKTRAGAVVDHAGIVRFDPTPYGGSRVHIRLSYRPPLGKLGASLGELFSLYPKHVLDDDLARFKSLVEQGKTTAHHHRVRLDSVVGGG